LTGFITDGHDGILTAISSLFATTPRQRCLVHKQRNVMNAIPKREQQEVNAELTGIWKQETRRGGAAQSGGLQSQVSEALS
jgi:transposase-like protein